ncbi:ribonuclease E inhibitor RraB, partial [Rheinheimera baltica]
QYGSGCETNPRTRRSAPRGESLCLCSLMISSKIDRLANSGIDISGFHELEFEFYVVGKAKLPSLAAEFYHPDNSMRVSTQKHPNGFGYSFRLRIDGILQEKDIAKTLVWLNNVANEHSVILENWRVVQKT